ncbi:MAG TPA: ABC-2 family transporter protein, partial [Spirochaetia bacterium]|nr:ABC-2 family transporter protein [Spirochaetia bacterium]
FQFLFTFVVPIAYIAFYPTQFFLTDALPDPLSWASPLFGAALFVLAVAIWNRGTRRWGATGS